jgi:hypothetical protein
MKKAYRYSFRIIFVIIFAVIAFLASGFFAVRWGWTNVAGEEDANSDAYNSIAKQEAEVYDLIARQETVLKTATTTVVVATTTSASSSVTSTQTGANLPEHLSIYGEHENLNWCLLGTAAKVSPYDAAGMFKAYLETKSEALLNHMILALELRKGRDSNFSLALKSCQNEPGEWNEEKLSQELASTTKVSAYTWQNSEYWQVIKESIVKDKAAIIKAAETSGIQPRLLVSVAIVEQLRLYYTQRELYEKLFKPLKILANANKMAWGVMSIKEKMAIETENHLHDIKSPYYLGPDSEKILDFSGGTDIAKERYNRLTNEKDHYYSYLYGSLIIKQFQEQWQKAGYDLKYRPEIIATLFNIGYSHSAPKANPTVGGSTLEINGEEYFFGSLAYEFYYSGELVEEFPFE